MQKQCKQEVELLGVERHKTHPMAFITLNEAWSSVGHRGTVRREKSCQASAARAIIEQQQESILGVQAAP